MNIRTMKGRQPQAHVESDLPGQMVMGMAQSVKVLLAAVHCINIAYCITIPLITTFGPSEVQIYIYICIDIAISHMQRYSKNHKYY